MSRPRVSIVLPTWNGEAHLARLLPALAGQRLVGGVEIVAIDSSSTDGTRRLLEEAGASVEVIEQSAFRHGEARNRCAARARGEFLVCLSQDAEPAHEDFLAELCAPFDDPAVAGVGARILPRPNDDPLTRRTALAQPEASERPAVREGDPDAGDAPRFNNVASALRAAVWRRIPFPDVDFGEDEAWARRALAAGYRLVFAPRAVCYHAHAYGPREAFERYRVDAAACLARTGRPLRPDLLSVLRGFGHEVLADFSFLARERPAGWLHHALRSPVLRAAQVLGQHKGSRRTGATPR